MRRAQDQPTAFPELNDLLTRFLAAVGSILADNLVGHYLTGSFALGSGDAASDCDFLVVTRGGLRPDEERSLRRLHAEIPATWRGYWAYNLEGSYAPQGDLRTLATIGRPWLYVDRGAREMAWSAHCNTADVRWILVERPCVLAGVDPRAFVCEVPARALQTSMRARIARFLDALERGASFDSWTQRYAVETSSRMLYTLEHGEVTSKQNALRWAAETMPAEWRGLIDQARRDRFLPWNDPPRRGSVDRTMAFVEYTRERARKEPRCRRTRRS